MAPMPAGTARSYPLTVRSADVDEFFAPQRTSTSALPEPEPLLRNLTRGVLEVPAGVREMEQLARWLTADAYRGLLTRANLATPARSAPGVHAPRPAHPILALRPWLPAPGAFEAVVI